MGFATAPVLRTSRKTITFDGTAGGGAAGTNVTVFTVTGEILVAAIVPYCTTLLTEAVAGATVSLGVTSSVVLFIAATNSPDIDADEFWVDTAPDARGVALPAALKDIVITENVVVAPATQNTDSGVVDFTLYWMALSTDASVS
jgi:hypothetical protein